MGILRPQASLSETRWVRRSCIGRGSFGEVSLAVDQATGEIFAVKSVSVDGNNQALRSLENEIQVLKSINFPWIVSYLGDDTTAEFPFGARRNLIMEYVGGGTVADRRRDENSARSYTRCLAKSLEYLHKNGIVHGDVKGRNLLLCSTWGEAKLADFGCARRIGSSEEEIWGGSPLWMAPEVVNGGAATPAADVWSLGCTLIEMVSGKVPWKVGESEDASHVLLRIGLGNQVPEFPENLSSSGKDFLDKCLKRNPAERMTCEELLRHPFLCDISPRGVSDWGNFGFDVEEDEEEEEKEEKIEFDVSCDDLMARLRGLGSSETNLVWEDEDDWEVVRPVWSSPIQEEEIEEEVYRSGAVSGDSGAYSGRREEELQEATSTPPRHLLRRRRCRTLFTLPLQRSPEFLLGFLFAKLDSVFNQTNGARPITIQIKQPNSWPVSFELLCAKKSGLRNKTRNAEKFYNHRRARGESVDWTRKLMRGSLIRSDSAS